MSISENRITTEKLIQAENQGVDGFTSAPDLSDLSKFKPEGLLGQLPPSIAQFSTYKELSLFTDSFFKGAGNVLNRAYNVGHNKNKVDLLNAGYDRYNKNQNNVNSSLGIVKAILCGDDNALVFNLGAIYRALDYDLSFLDALNICGRQKVRNPVDTLLKGIDNLERQSRMLGNIGPRFLNNIERLTKKLIRKLNLPRSLERCLNMKALTQGQSQLGDGLSLGRLKDLIRSLSPDICSSSPSGVSNNNYTLRKMSAQPFVRGIANYDRQSMYGFYSGVLSSNALEKELLLEILSESFTDGGMKNASKLLEMIAFTKVSTLEININININNNIGSINNVMQNTKDSPDIALDAILSAVDCSQTVSPDTVTNVNNNAKDDSLNVKFDAGNILSVMEDNLAETSKDPVKEFNNLMKLLNIADSKFKPEENVSSLSTCKTTNELSVKGMKQNKLPELTQDTFRVGNSTYLRVTDTISVMDVVGGICEECTTTAGNNVANF